MASTARAYAPNADVGPNERVGVTFFFSLIVHAVVLLGVTFAFEDPASSLSTLDVILLQTRTDDVPEKPDFLANTSQKGGGEHDKAERPGKPFIGQSAEPTAGIAPQPIKASSPPPVEARIRPTLNAEQSPLQAQKPQKDVLPEELVNLSERELTQREMEMAQITAQMEALQNQIANRPKIKFINASTTEAEYAPYMYAWVKRIERIGTLNFPEEAKRRRLIGSLELVVAVRKDGSVQSVTISKPSGDRILDEAAIRIVRLAEPFAPFDTKAKDDILQITRTWQFLPGEIQVRAR